MWTVFRCIGRKFNWEPFAAASCARERGSRLNGPRHNVSLDTSLRKFRFGTNCGLKWLCRLHAGVDDLERIEGFDPKLLEPGQDRRSGRTRARSGASGTGGSYLQTCSAGDVPGQWLFNVSTTPISQLDLARSIINTSLAGMRTCTRISLKRYRRQPISFARLTLDMMDRSETTGF